MTATIHIDGSFRQGYVPLAKKPPLDPVIAEAYSTARENLTYEGAPSGLPTAQYIQDLEAKIKGSPPLGLSNARNLRRPKITRGLKGMTGQQRLRVRCGATYLQQEFGNKYLSFFTGTLPRLTIPCTKEEWKLIVKYWRDKMTESLTHMGLPPYIVGCVEIQTRRLRKYGELCLHLHAVFPNRLPMKSWALSLQSLQQVWNDCLMIVLGESRIIGSLKSTTNVQRVKRSAAGYLGKYMSKSHKEIKALVSDGFGEQLPSSWNLITRPLLKKVREAEIRFTGKDAEDLLETLTKSPGQYVVWSRPVKIFLKSGFELRVGFVAQLNEVGMSTVKVAAACRVHSPCKMST